MGSQRQKATKNRKSNFHPRRGGEIRLIKKLSLPVLSSEHIGCFSSTNDTIPERNALVKGFFRIFMGRFDEKTAWRGFVFLRFCEKPILEKPRPLWYDETVEIVWHRIRIFESNGMNEVRDD